MPLCRFCNHVETNDAACPQCTQHIMAARTAREVMEARITELEDRIAFVFNTFRMAVASPLVGMPPFVTPLGEIYEKQKQAKLEAAAVAAATQPTGLINA